MSTATLHNLRDYLCGSLSMTDMLWLVEELKKHMAENEAIKPYTMKEIDMRIAKAEEDFAEGRYYTDAEVFADLEGAMAAED